MTSPPTRRFSREVGRSSRKSRHRGSDTEVPRRDRSNTNTTRARCSSVAMASFRFCRRPSARHSTASSAPMRAPPPGRSGPSRARRRALHTSGVPEDSRARADFADVRRLRAPPWAAPAPPRAGARLRPPTPSSTDGRRHVALRRAGSISSRALRGRRRAPRARAFRARALRRCSAWLARDVHALPRGFVRRPSGSAPARALLSPQRRRAGPTYRQRRLSQAPWSARRAARCGCVFSVGSCPFVGATRPAPPRHRSPDVVRGDTFGTRIETGRPHAGLRGARPLVSAPTRRHRRRGVRLVRDRGAERTRAPRLPDAAEPRARRARAPARPGGHVRGNRR